METVYQLVDFICNSPHYGGGIDPLDVTDIFWSFPHNEERVLAELRRYKDYVVAYEKDHPVAE